MTLSSVGCTCTNFLELKSSEDLQLPRTKSKYSRFMTMSFDRSTVLMIAMHISTVSCSKDDTSGCSKP